MIYPSADRLEDKVGNKYSLVIVAAKRARQLKEGAMPLAESKSQNPLSIAMDEVAASKVIALEPPDVQEREAALTGAYAQDDTSAAVLLASLGDDAESEEEDILGLADDEEEEEEQAEEEAEPLGLTTLEEDEAEEAEEEADEETEEE